MDFGRYRLLGCHCKMVDMWNETFFNRYKDHGLGTELNNLKDTKYGY